MGMAGGSRKWMKEMILRLRIYTWKLSEGQLTSSEGFCSNAYKAMPVVKHMEMETHDFMPVGPVLWRHFT